MGDKQNYRNFIAVSTISNSLPPNSCNSDSLQWFKNQLKTHFQDSLQYPSTNMSCQNFEIEVIIFWMELELYSEVVNCLWPTPMYCFL